MAAWRPGGWKRLASRPGLLPNICSRRELAPARLWWKNNRAGRFVRGLLGWGTLIRQGGAVSVEPPALLALPCSLQHGMAWHSTVGRDTG